MERKLSQELNPCKSCPCGNNIYFDVGGFGLDTCCKCGTCVPGMIGDVNQYISSDRIVPACVYTRRKRFRKYLMRANRHQSVSTVPGETWEYLIKWSPYQTPRHLYLRLKAGKGIKRKCYDSLPLMCTHLCLQPVPSLSEREMSQATRYFDVIERHIERTGESMISYLFCLEFILKKMGRTDMLEFLNRIKCPTRRRTYTERLTAIFRPDTIIELLMAN